MSNFTVDKIRNVCLMAHGHTGKTALVEAMLFNAKATDRFGKIPEGNTVSDFDPEEIKRKISINTTVEPFEWNGCKINLIDTPGYFDFVGEAAGGVRVADAALIPVSGKSGVAVGTEQAWERAKANGLSVIFFINKMEDENADYNKIVADLNNRFGKSVAPFQYPLYENGTLMGFVDVVDQQAYRFETGNRVPIDTPADADISDMRQMLVEAVAETSEELMEKFFADIPFTREEMVGALRSGIKDGSVVPVLMGSALQNIGIISLMNSIAEYFPAPNERDAEVATNAKTGEEITLKYDPNAPLAAIVFKTIADPYVGKLSLFKVLQGTMKADSTVYNPRTDSTEKIGKISMLRGKKQNDTPSVTAGDIGAVAKLVQTSTGDTLSGTATPIRLEGIPFPIAVLDMAIEPLEKGDEEKINAGLTKLMEEDPSFTLTHNHETHQTLIGGQGELHLDVLVSKLKSKFGVDCKLVEPIIPYREAIRKNVRVEGKHKKQSGGHGQYGHVWIEFEPNDDGLLFEEKVFGGSVPRNFFPAVEKGLKECMDHGVLAGYPVVGLKATLVDGSYHPVDSSEMAFKMAASIAFKEGLKQASPVLLEPIGTLEVTVPEDNMGDIIGDINKRRGRILGMNPIGSGLSKVEAEVPMAEMFKYATDLRSMTQGRGKFVYTFVRYEDAPQNVAQKVMEDAKKEE